MKWPARTVLPYGVAALCAIALAVAGTALRGTFPEVLLIIPMAATALVAFRLGAGPAVAFGAGVGLAIWFWVLKPHGSFALANELQLADLAFYLLASVLVTVAIALLQRERRKLEVDITERKRVEGELRRHEEALRESARRKDDFLAVLSHELRNPLAPVRNALYILEHAQPGGLQAVRAREVISRQSDHLARLVDDLLDVTRISRGKVQLQLARVDLREIVLRTVDDHRPLFDAGGVALDVRTAPGAYPVDADPTRVAQMLGNLLQNSVKFTRPGGRVSVLLEREQDRAIIRVADTGVGIAPEMIGRIFEPFTQADESLHRSRGGLGLGLALVKGFATLHGGDVEARSAGEGRGAELVVTLPLAPGAPAPAVRAMDQAIAHGSGARRVLIIEDNVDAAETLRIALEVAGHDVAIAQDGRVGVALARAFWPDVVLCDIGLPEMDGYAVARALRADPALATTALVALTGYGLAGDHRRAMDAGFDVHLTKPASVALIEEALASAAPRERDRDRARAAVGA